MNKKEQFIRNGLSCLGYKSKHDLIENLYLKSIIDSYGRIDKCIGIENDIRDRLVHDFYFDNKITKDLLQKNILFINWERWVFKNETDLGRADLSFAISGLEFIVECKRLKNVNQKYIDEGLYRFLNNEYSEHESCSAMLGFVIEGNIEHIRSGIMRKCEKERCVQNDFSRQKYTDWEYNFKTTHSRKNNSEINIYHLFFEFVKN
ncbi:MAG: hypothetical protein M0Q53_18130 [Prolixibacteraceae bacterium]|jgi:hypothetical protein|nr:hypothetical protein [Prolixibacteraceae bacterium]